MWGWYLEWGQVARIAIRQRDLLRRRGLRRNHAVSESRLQPEAYPYWPYFEMDAADGFWGAKLVMRFDRTLLEAIVKKAQLSDPEAAAYLVDTLLARRTKIGRSYLEAVTPLDDFATEPNRLCAVDLGMVYGLAKQSVVEGLDANDKVVTRHTVGSDGRVCIPVRADVKARSAVSHVLPDFVHHDVAPPATGVVRDFQHRTPAAQRGNVPGAPSEHLARAACG